MENAMSVSFDVVAESRSDTGKGASRRLRRRGLVPAIVYGGHLDPQTIAVTHSQMVRHLEHESFYSHVLNLKLGDSTIAVVLKDLQRHPAKPFLLHADFMRVSQDEKLRMVVPLHFLNEEKSLGIKAGGNVSHLLTEIEIACLPKDLPEFIGLDLIELDVGGIVHLSEIPLPEGVTLAHAPDPDEAVVVMHGAHAGAEVAEGEEGEA
jgi:large subunit ribosomal protein L25